MIKESLPLRVLAISFIVLALPLIVDSFIFFQKSYYESIKDAKNELREVGSLRASDLAEAYPVRPVLLADVIFFLHLSEEIGHLPNEKINSSLKELAEIKGDAVFAILDAGTDNVFEVLASDESDFVHTKVKSFVDIPKIIKDGSGYFLRYFYVEKDKIYAPFLFVGKAIYSKDNEPLGVLLVGTNAEKQVQSVLQPRLGSRGDLVNFAILNSEGIVFAAAEPDLIGNYFLPITPNRKQQVLDSRLLGDVALASKPVTVIEQAGDANFEFIFQDTVKMGYLSSISPYNFYLLSYSAKEAIFTRAIQHFLIIYTVYGLILLIGGAVTYWFTLWFSRPLGQLSGLMAKVRQGILGDRFKPERLGFELNMLGGMFNQTLDALLENMQKAEDERVLKETFKKELKLGQEVQRNLLPQKMPSVAGVEIASTYIYAQSVGGDFYDILTKEDGTLVLMLADAAGTGISSCLYALGVRSLMRTYAMLHGDAGRIITETNNLFIKDTGDTGMFVTALLGLYDPKLMRLSYYSAGHVPGLIRRENGHIEVMRHSGMALGLTEFKNIVADTVSLAPGDMVLLFTDGLIDVENEKHQHFTLQRLMSILQQRKWETANEMIEGLTAEVKDFIKEYPQGEEITIVVFKVLE